MIESEEDRLTIFGRNFYVPRWVMCIVSVVAIPLVLFGAGVTFVAMFLLDVNGER